MTLTRLLRFTSILLIACLWLNSMYVETVAWAVGKPTSPAAIKAKVQARGVGQGVRVTLSDNTDAKGIIVSIAEDSFALKPKGAGQPREIQFTEITGVHSDKMGTGTKIIIVAVIAGAVIAIVAAVFVHRFDDGFKNFTV